MPARHSKKQREFAIALAEKALRALGQEDLLYTHHGDVHARAAAYERLADFFEEYSGEVLFAERKSSVLR